MDPTPISNKLTTTSFGSYPMSSLASLLFLLSKQVKQEIPALQDMSLSVVPAGSTIVSTVHTSLRHNFNYRTYISLSIICVRVFFEPAAPLCCDTELSSPVQVELQVGEDELLLNELPDDTSHLISLHLHHGAGLDLLRHLRGWWETRRQKDRRRQETTCQRE